MIKIYLKNDKSKHPFFFFLIRQKNQNKRNVERLEIQGVVFLFHINTFKWLCWVMIFIFNIIELLQKIIMLRAWILPAYKKVPSHTYLLRDLYYFFFFLSTVYSRYILLWLITQGTFTEALGKFKSFFVIKF